MSLKAIFLYQGEIIEATSPDREMNGYNGPAIFLIDVEGAVKLGMLHRKGIYRATHALYRYILFAIHTS